MCVFVFISLIVTYTGSFNKKSVVLSLNYEEASKGQNPNLTRYNVYELKSDRVKMCIRDRQKEVICIIYEDVGRKRGGILCLLPFFHNKTNEV